MYSFGLGMDGEMIKTKCQSRGWAGADWQSKEISSATCAALARKRLILEIHHSTNNNECNAKVTVGARPREF